MDAQTKEALLLKKEIVSKRFKEIMQELYGERLSKIILYGSYARGDFHEESDIDFLVVLNDEEIKRLEERRKIRQYVDYLDSSWGIYVSAVPMPLQKFLWDKTPLLHFVRKEGVEI
ncbi:MAG: nucleotidyltransferase domain-containing protein [Thermoflexibacter sp.]|jgi:predicted nucleotidyltransferase|nr:nucleotidyltransferase domain-containing protein [Thermoflexibacter sp.]